MAGNEFVDSGGFVWVDTPGFEWEGEQLPTGVIRLTRPRFRAQPAPYGFKDKTTRPGFKGGGGSNQFRDLSPRLSLALATINFGFRDLSSRPGFTTGSIGYRLHHMGTAMRFYGTADLFAFREMGTRLGFAGATLQYGFTPMT